MRSITGAAGGSLVASRTRLMVALAGRPSLSVQEVSDARQATEAARAAGSERYAAETLQAAEAQAGRALADLCGDYYQAARSTGLFAKKHAILAREIAVSVQATQ